MQSGHTDIFQHENESVDLLLQELNLEGIKSPLDSFEPTPLSGSPIKPLNYPQGHKQEKSLKEDADVVGSRKDFNSSSDTCVSEPNDENHGISSNNERENQVHTKSAKSARNGETSKNSPVKSAPISPSKSSMKSVGTPSPKKSVAFQPSRDTFHSYTAKDADAVSLSGPQDPSVSDSVTDHVTHAWTEVSDQANTSHDVTMTPPAPPPHTSHTITGLLTSSNSDFFARDDDENGADLDASKLEELKKHRRFSNLSLNEKLSVFLEPSKSSNHDDLDAHLEQLGQATNEETDVNIHRLSYHMNTHEKQAESPFHALSKSSDLYLNSAHSSQSSLQSLVESNRQLPADKVNSTSTGIQLYDGIKGFPDRMASAIIPMSNGVSGAEDSFSDSSVGSKFSFSQIDAEPHPIQHHHSYDQSFNSTEKSILNLLGPSDDLRGGNVQKGQIQVKPEPVSDAQSEDVYVKKEESQNSFVKREDSQNSFRFKTEDDIPDSPASEYRPEIPEIKQEPAENVGPAESVKQEETYLVNKADVTTSRKVERIADTVGIPAGSIVKSEPQNSPQQISSRGLANHDHSDAESHHSQELSFATHDPAADFVTFQVDERAVTPGPVKLVLSRESPSSGEATRVSDCVQDASISSAESSGTSRVKLVTAHHQPAEHADSSDSVDSDAYKDSVDYSLKSLAPPRSPQKNDPNKGNILGEENDGILDTAEKEVEPAESKSKSNFEKSVSHDGDNSVLANSSNISPPLNIKLPDVEKDAGGFEDLTAKLAGSSSFEESLSAEHDADKKPLNFLSIWHTQSTLKKPLKPLQKDAFYKAPSLSKYNIADISRRGKYALPASVQPKKFKDVNVVSTRVLSKTFEDLNVSQFLPELSQDSGFEGHFRSLMRDVTPRGEDSREVSGAGESMQYRRRQSFDSSNVLAALRRRDSNASRDAMSRDVSITGRRRGSVGDTLRPPAPNQTSAPRRSRFHVPSFEIKRSDSVLSPKNQYDDIFHDGSFVEPTIKSAGMKTLPSMDRDDVRRIMHMKQAMSVEEYSRLKNVGASMASAMQAEEPTAAQQASIHGDVAGSRAVSTQLASIVNPGHVTGDYVQDDLNERPQLAEPFEAKAVQPPKVADKEKKNEQPLVSSVVQVSVDSNRMQDKPNGPVRRMSDHNPFRTAKKELKTFVGPADTETAPDPTHRFVVKSWNDITPSGVSAKSPKKQVPNSARSSPIKIHSPVKLVTKNGTVTGVVLDKKIPDPPAAPSLQNKKLRGDKNLSTVSVPSNVFSDVTSHAEHTSNRSAAASQTGKPPQMVKLEEKGKLFFRVVALNNLGVPEMTGRNVAFNLTLDNGIHCIKTPNYRLESSSVAIDKEFELSVSDSLEFILTLKATYSKAKPGYREVKERKVVRSKNKISRLFGSKEIVTTTKFVPHENADPLESVFATDGSFGRCFVDIDSYKSQISGQACNYQLVCFNEWATYTHNGERISQKPYPVASLDVRMLYVPRSADFEILPTSIKSAYESLDDLKRERRIDLEGYLHQEGGDCETWKRRWFKLTGTSLVAHSEFSHKTRAKINLAKVAEVIYVDKENIQQSAANYRNFSDIHLMENAFKIRFADGEVIDFGAPTRAEKQAWIQCMQDIVCRNKFRRQPWVKMMQERNGDKRTSWIVRD